MALQVWLPLNGDLHNQGLDDITFTQTTIAGYEAGKIGQALEILNSNVFFTVPSLTDAKVFSVAFWYKAISDSSITTKWRRVLSFDTKNADGTAGSLFRFESSYAITGYALSVHNNTSRSLGSIGHAIVTNFDEWHHICFTHTAEQNLTYLDGILVRTGVGAAGTINGTVKISDTSAGTDPHGLMNDLRIYDHCLSTKEVKELSKGLVAHYPLNDGVGGENLLNSSESNSSLIRSSSTGTGSFEAATWVGTLFGKTWMNNHLTPGQQYTLSYKVTCLSRPTGTFTGTETRPMPILVHQGSGMSQHTSAIGGTNTTDIPEGESRTFITNFTFDTISESDEYYGLCLYTMLFKASSGNQYATFRISNLKLEEGSVATPWIPNPNDELYSTMGLDSGIVYDCSGYGHNGEIVGDVFSASNSPRYSSATHLNSTNLNTYTYIEGAAAYIKCPVELTNPTSFTISLWAKIEGSYNNGGHGLISASLVDLPADYLIATFNNRDNSFDINSSDGNSHIRPILPFIFNQWTHYALTYNGKTATTYRDGVLYNSASFSSDTALGSMNKIVIGLSTAGGVWRKILGDYSDVRLYATALSADDIKELYETSASVDSHGNIYGHEVVE